MPAAQTREAIQQLGLLHKLPRDRRLMCSIERMIESYMFLTFFIPYMYIHSKKVDLCKTIFNLFFICMFYKEIYFHLKGECSYAASIGVKLTGDSAINSMIKIRKGIPCYPKAAYRLFESVLEGVFIGTNFASHFVYKLLRSI